MPLQLKNRSQDQIATRMIHLWLLSIMHRLGEENLQKPKAIIVLSLPAIKNSRKTKKQQNNEWIEKTIKEFQDKLNASTNS
jgi:hypothetical protein